MRLNCEHAFRGWVRKSMRTKFYSLFLVLAVFGAPSFAVENPFVRSPIGSPTVPPSSVRRGLVRTPNPIDTSGNLVVTGNVAGGKHFRGVVPYRSTKTFTEPTGSGFLDPFRRYSDYSGNFSPYTTKLTPFYSQTNTVTKFRSGTTEIFRPPVMSITRSPQERPSLRKEDFLVDFPEMRGVRDRPMSSTTEELEKVLVRDTKTYPQRYQKPEVKPEDGEYRRQMDRFRDELKQASAKLDELSRDLIGEERVTKEQALGIPEGFGRQRQGFEELGQLRDTREQEEARLAEVDVYTQMRLRAERVQEFLLQHEDKERPVKPKDEEKAEEGEPVDEEKAQQEKREEAVLSADLAKGVLGEYKTFSSFADDKFSQHMRAGEKYLKGGKYYWAANAYTVASVYRPKDPLAYAGKSHALFAAGEYMSSALFLARAIEIFPEYAQFKVDLEAMVGNRDKLESRIVDVEEWYERNRTPELQFLLGYVYYQMDGMSRAREVISEAYKRMPDSPAVAALKTAIDKRKR